MKEQDETSREVSEAACQPPGSGASGLPNSPPQQAQQQASNGRQRKVAPRKDSGKLHRVQHGLLSREILTMLIRLGENPKTYRRLERQFRAALRPSPPWGSLLFDRFWSSYLRLMVIGCVEAKLLAGKSTSDVPAPSLLRLAPGDQPRLVLPEPNGERLKGERSDLPPGLLQALVLAQRYDGHYGREMYRALGLLLLLRRSGEAGLETWAVEMLGTGKSSSEHGGANDA